MNDIDVRQQAQQGPIVWVLSKGPFVEAARSIPFDLDDAWQDDNGAVNAHGGCDWVALEPHPLITTPQLD